MSEIKFNINHYVRIKLTEKGKEILENMRYTEHLRAAIDVEGWVKLQTWQVFSLFGEHMCAGCDLPFETEIVIITET